MNYRKQRVEAQEAAELPQGNTPGPANISRSEIGELISMRSWLTKGIISVDMKFTKIMFIFLRNISFHDQSLLAVVLASFSCLDSVHESSCLSVGTSLTR